jgi:hypothetical protein
MRSAAALLRTQYTCVLRERAPDLAEAPPLPSRLRPTCRVSCLVVARVMHLLHCLVHSHRRRCVSTNTAAALAAGTPTQARVERTLLRSRSFTAALYAQARRSATWCALHPESDVKRHRTLQARSQERVVCAPVPRSVASACLQAFMTPASQSLNQGVNTLTRMPASGCGARSAASGGSMIAGLPASTIAAYTIAASRTLAASTPVCLHCARTWGRGPAEKCGGTRQ